MYITLLHSDNSVGLSKLEREEVVQKHLMLGQGQKDVQRRLLLVAEYLYL